MKRILLPGMLILLLAGCASAGGTASGSGVASASPPASSAPAKPATSAVLPSAGPSASGKPAASTAPSTVASAKPAASGASSASAKPAPSASSSASGSASPSGGLTGAFAVEDATIRAVQQVSPGVVQITHPVQQQGQQGVALGSGTIIDDQGHILTNAHVAAGASTYKVTLSNNQTVEGKLVGLDEFDDLAVIQVSGGAKLPVVQIGDSSALKVGQTVLAIGNPIGYTQTVTNGIVSALERTITEPPSPVTGQQTTIPNMIQISAPINPGNSGGALIDLSGKIVGVPTLAAIDPELNQQAAGIAFAVPINRARVIIPQLISQGKIVHSGRAFLGVGVVPLTPRLASVYGFPVQQGLYIANVASNSGAGKAGLQQGDIMVKVDSKEVVTGADLQDILLQKKPGDQVSISLYRGSNQMTVTATLSEAPANQG